MQTNHYDNEDKNQKQPMTAEEYEKKIRYLNMQLEECMEELDLLRNGRDSKKEKGKVENSAASQEMIAKYQNTIERLRSELAAQKAINLALKSDINMIHNSISWRLTAPIRAIGDFFAKKK